MTARTRAGAMYLYTGVIVLGAASASAGVLTAGASHQGAQISGGSRVPGGSFVVTTAQMPVAAMTYTAPGASVFSAQTMTATASLARATMGVYAWSAGVADRLAAMNISSPWRGLAVLPQTPAQHRRAAAMYLYTGLVVEGSASISAGPLLASAALQPALLMVTGEIAILPGAVGFQMPQRPLEVAGRERSLGVSAVERSTVVTARERAVDAILAPQRTVEFSTELRDDAE